MIDEQIHWIRKQILAEHKVINCPLKSKNKEENHLQWTGTQVEFVELVYSLHDAGSINNGNISLKELFTEVGRIFNFLITNYYQYFSDITRRTGDRTLFLDKLKKMFLKHLTESDNR